MERCNLCVLFPSTELLTAEVTSTLRGCLLRFEFVGVLFDEMCDELAPPTTDVGNDENMPELLEDFLGVFSFSEVFAVVFVMFTCCKPIEVLDWMMELSLDFTEPLSVFGFSTPVGEIGSFEGILSTKFGGKYGYGHPKSECILFKAFTKLSTLAALLLSFVSQLTI